MVYARRKKKMQAVRVVKARKARRILLPKDVRKTEIKYFDTVATSANCSTNGYILQLNNMGQGILSNARIGNRVHLKWSGLKLIVNDNSACVTDSVVRAMLVYDTETDGALPAVGGSLTSNSILDNTNGLSPLSFRNPNNIARYKIIYDEIIQVNHGAMQAVTGTTTTAFPVKVHRKTNKTLNSFSQYNGAGSTIADINSGAMYIVLLSDIATGANAPLVAYQHRLYYTDN